MVTFNLSGAFNLKLMNTLLSKDLILALSALVTVEHRKKLNRKKLSLTYLTVRKLLNDINILSDELFIVNKWPVTRHFQVDLVQDCQDYLAVG